MKTSILREIIVLGCIALFCGLFWSGVFITDAAGNIYTSNHIMWADSAAHLMMISKSAYGNVFDTASPFLVGEPYNYPYFINAVTGLLIKVFNLNIFTTFMLSGFILSTACLYSVFSVLKSLLKSWWQSTVAFILFTTQSGLGLWWQLAHNDFNQSDFLASYVSHLEQFGIHFGNSFVTTFFNQRALLLGVLIWSFTILLLTKAFKYRHFLVAGLLAGTLIFVHVHTLISLFFIIGTAASIDLLQSKDKLKKALHWSTFAAGTLIIASPKLLLYTQTLETSEFISINLWWYAQTFGGWLLFWFKNWGIIPIVALVSIGLMLHEKLRKKQQFPIQQQLLAGFVVLFIAANSVQWQPNIWDNTKLFFIVSIGFSALTSWLLFFVWQHSKYIAGLLGLLIVLNNISGLHDLGTLLNHQSHRYLSYTHEEIELAHWVENSTPTNTVWLTSDKHNHWLGNLTGRQIVMAYRGWLWTHGYDYTEHQQAVRAIYGLSPNTEKYLDKYGITHIVIGPSEINDWGAQKTQLENKFEVIKRTDNYTIVATQQ